MKKLLKKIKDYFLKKRKNVKKNSKKQKQYFKQTCVFAHSELEGDMRIFKMQSGRVLLCRLHTIKNPYNNTADDTAQRDLIWEVISDLEIERNLEKGTLIIKYDKYTLEVAEDPSTDEVDFWKRISDEWIKNFYPEQNAGFRFLRGT